MRLAVAVALAAALPALSHAQDRSGAAAPTPAPNATPAPQATPAPKAEPAPQATPAPRAEATPKTGAAPKAAPAKPPPAAAFELARALLTSEQWAKVLDSYASSLSGQISQKLLSEGEKVPDDLRGKLLAELQKTLPYHETVQAQAGALAKELTPEELRKTAAFYSSALGHKVLERLPDAQAEVAQQLQGRLATAVPEIVNRLAPKAMAAGPRGATGNGTGSAGSTSGGAAGGAPPAHPGQTPPAQGRPPPPGGGTR